MPASATPAFELLDVSKRYGRRWALSRLSFRLERGGALLLTGHNGSGKSTLLRLLATATSPTTGATRILGLDPKHDPARVRRDVALLSHASFLYEDLSAEQNLTLLARLLDLPQPQAATNALLYPRGQRTLPHRAAR